MYNRILVLIAVFIIFSCDSLAQSCRLTLTGHVFDEGSEVPLSFVNVFIQELGKGAVTNDKGSFFIGELCPGEYHITFSHIGCEAKKIHLDLARDTSLQIVLSHSPTSLGEVTIEGQQNVVNTQPSVSVNRQLIENNINQSLAGLLENEAGVHLIKNGSSIAKPVVQGLYGNRLIILNNGIIQSGQQWGNDHAPEIDPLSADRITILKGTSAIEYGSGNLGSVILVEPKRIRQEPHLHGQVNYMYETNGRGSTLNARLGKYSSAIAWRVNGTFRRYGDQRAPDYFLNNTGFQEASLSLQLEKTWKDRLFFDFYASTFNTRLGVLRGSHIGNLTDLESALSRETPFFTEDTFSYQIDAPKQHVSHHLVKGKLKYFLSDNQVLEVILAGQINDRKEFDVRRGGRTETPAFSLLQLSFNSEITYTHHLGEDWKFKLGNQNIFTDNTNNPETGIFPLIPDYTSFKSGSFATLAKKANRFHINTGIRYDFEQQFVAAFTRSFPRELVRYDNQFHNLSGLLALKLNLAKHHSLSLNSGYAMRNPAINELYSFGLHQGVSGIEEGDINLNTERALKNSLEYEWIPNANFSFNALVYHQRFSDFIYLNPEDRFRLTIRGAFPVFTYKQTDAQIYGLDVSTQFTINDALLGTIRYSYLRGDDLENDVPLVYMPPNSLFGSLTYRARKHIKLSSKANIEDTELEVTNRLVFEQKHLLPGQDFTPPPPTYNLLGVKLSTNLILSKYKFRCFVSARNLLNVRYRDYLNRQRYFADEQGVSVTAGVGVKF